MEASSVSQHPPHLVDPSGSLQPSAFIPFCSYQTNLSMLGSTINTFSFPVCTAFEPSILHGDLCYTLDMEKVPGAKLSESGKAKGIMIVLDPNQERSETGRAVLQRRMETGKQFLNLSPKTSLQSSVQLHIHTLVRFQVYSEGSFTLRHSFTKTK